jgi:hypothetical protein
VSLFRASIMAAVVLALCSQGRSDPAPVIRYAPAENLEHIDVALIERAKHEIDNVCPDGLDRHANAHARRRSWREGPHLSRRRTARRARAKSD